jgi:hypothetical protein
MLEKATMMRRTARIVDQDVNPPKGSNCRLYRRLASGSVSYIGHMGKGARSGCRKFSLRALQVLSCATGDRNPSAFRSKTKRRCFPYSSTASSNNDNFAIQAKLHLQFSSNRPCRFLRTKART